MPCVVVVFALMFVNIYTQALSLELGRQTTEYLYMRDVRNFRATLLKSLAASVAGQQFHALRGSSGGSRRLGEAFLARAAQPWRDAEPCNGAATIPSAAPRSPW